MAREIIAIGTVANDGTGDTLRSSLNKANLNFAELYNTFGWGQYVDSIATNLTINSTASKLTINSLGASTNVAYLPRAIRGSGNLWNSTTNKITPINLGDAYDLRIDFRVLTKTASPTTVDLTLDIGGAAGITNAIVVRSISVMATPPYTISVGFPIFCLANFITNGGQIFLHTDTGSLTVGLRNVMIKRDFNGQL